LYRGTIVKALNEELGNIRLTELTASNVQGALSTLAGRLFYLKELAEPLVAECN